jgi:hypothetical protein
MEDLASQLAKTLERAEKEHENEILHSRAQVSPPRTLEYSTETEQQKWTIPVETTSQNGRKFFWLGFDSLVT